MKLISVVGTSGSGKTTFAARLAEILLYRHIELDVLHWAPGWVEKPDSEFLALLRKEIEGDAWITDGNYSISHSTIHPRVDTMIWLDYPFFTVWARALRRTFSRVVKREKIWHDNVETLSTAFSRYGIPAWVVRTYWKNRRRYSEMIAEGRPASATWIRLQSPREAEAFLSRLAEQQSRPH